MTARQAVEFFHLVFLRALVAKGDDKGLFAVKGGCNLRFFFGSVRYSEDLDIDVSVVAKETLKRKIDRLLVSPTLVAPLRARGIELVDISTPKQTDTTQRWKAGLKAATFPLPIRTKVEFSRRGRIEGARFEAIDSAILRGNALPPFLATHYSVSQAVEQKIHALAGRTEPQARDVFDLSHLFARQGPSTSALATEKRYLSLAIDHALGISFDEYSSQVVAYLDPDQRELFAERSVWNVMQTTVISRLEALQ